MFEFDPQGRLPRDMHKLVSGVVVPRPIALVVTLGPQGPNAAPFSFFNLVCQDPSMLMFSMAPRPGTTTMKDTILNLDFCPEFVVHIVDESNRERMNRCSEEVPYGVNEIARSGLHALPSRKVRPPRIAEMPVHLECRLERLVKLGRMPYTMVIGEIVYAHFRDGLVDADRLHVHAERLHAMGRMEGGDMYTRTQDRFSMPRPGAGS